MQAQECSNNSAVESVSVRRLCVQNVRHVLCIQVRLLYGSMSVSLRSMCTQMLLSNLHMSGTANIIISQIEF